MPQTSETPGEEPTPETRLAMQLHAANEREAHMTKEASRLHQRATTLYDELDHERRRRDDAIKTGEGLLDAANSLRKQLDEARALLRRAQNCVTFGGNLDADIAAALPPEVKDE